MTSRWVGFVTVGESINVVDAEIPDDPSEPINILADNTWPLQKGDKAAAYAVLHQRTTDYLTENQVDKAIIKASALPTGSVKLAHLVSAGSWSGHCRRRIELCSQANFQGGNQPYLR